jgi:hypothetical protein
MLLGVAATYERLAECGAEDKQALTTNICIVFMRSTFFTVVVDKPIAAAANPNWPPFEQF